MTPHKSHMFFEVLKIGSVRWAYKHYGVRPPKGGGRRSSSLLDLNSSTWNMEEKLNGKPDFHPFTASWAFRNPTSDRIAFCRFSVRIRVPPQRTGQIEVSFGWHTSTRRFESYFSDIRKIAKWIRQSSETRSNRKKLLTTLSPQLNLLRI